MSRRLMRRFYAQSDRIDTRKECLIWKRLSLEQARRMARECRAQDLGNWSYLLHFSHAMGWNVICKRKAAARKAAGVA